MKELALKALHYLHQLEDREGYLNESPVSKCIDYLQNEYLN